MVGVAHEVLRAPPRAPNAIVARRGRRDRSTCLVRASTASRGFDCDGAPRAPPLLWPRAPAAPPRPPTSRPVSERPFVTSSSSSSRQPAQGDAAAPERVSALRVAVWVAIAIVLATGVILYFRHQDEVVPVLGAASGEASPR